MHEASIKKSAIFVKCSRAATKVYQNWNVRQKIGSERTNCGCHRMVNDRAEQIVKYKTVTAQKIAADLNQEIFQSLSLSLRALCIIWPQKAQSHCEQANKMKCLKFVQANTIKRYRIGKK
ncbi:hypothetical protein TNCV_2944891 [Trichonephila clavipes]|nr:hypothetical protein TNCV_2944891 [Trichonephila clavipes]